MKTTILIIVIILSSILSFGAVRTWDGGGGDDNWGTANNWDCNCVPAAADDAVVTITKTASGSENIDIDANYTIASLTVSVTATMGGNPGLRYILYINSSTNTLTVTGDAVLNTFSKGSIYFQPETSPGGFVIQGDCSLDDGSSTGPGIVYCIGDATGVGTLELDGDLYLGPRARTGAGIEPNILFDGTGTQTVSTNIVVTFFLGEDVTIGSTNTPTVVVTDNSAYEFGIFDGSLTIKAGATLETDYGFNPLGTGVDVDFGAGSLFKVYSTTALSSYTNNKIHSTATIEYAGAGNQTVEVLPTTPNDGYGHLTLSGGGTKTSEASFSIRGDFTGNASWFDGNDTHTFNGTVDQSISGSVEPLFYNVTVNKSSGDLNLDVNMDIDRDLILTNGAFILNANPVTLDMTTLFWSTCSCSAITRTNGYIVSEHEDKQIRWFARHSNFAHEYPFGTIAGTYIPFSYGVTAGTVSYVDLSTWSTGSDNTTWATGVAHMFDPTLGQDGSDEAVIDRWWVITDELATQTADITFTYPGVENTLIAPYQTGAIGAQRWNGSTWDAPLGSSIAVTAGTGSVAVTGVSSFSPWVLSSIAAPLPIELMNFEAKVNGQSVEINWQTATEINNDFFTVERSNNTIDWEDVATIKGAGTSSNIISYSDFDYTPLPNISYYRLKQVDFNGDFSYSNTISVNFKSINENDFTIFPNPSNGSNVLMELIGFQNKEVLIEVIDITGKVIYSRNMMNISESEKFVLIDKIAAGLYITSIYSEGQIISKKLIVK